MRTLLNETMCVVVDIQEKLAPAINDFPAIQENCVKLLEGLNVLGVPVLVGRQYPKGLGDTIPEIKSITENCEVFDKTNFSCFKEESFKDAILKQNKKNVIIFGIELHICVLQTVIDLKEAGFNPILIEDCCGSRKDNDKKMGLKRTIQEGVTVSTYESILFELVGKAGSDEFKKISQIIK